MRKPVKQSSRGWANSISTSSSIVSCVSSGSMRMLAVRRSRIARPSKRPSRRSNFATSNRLAVRASTRLIKISLEPTGPGGGYEFVDEIKGGRVPREYIPSVDAGIKNALDQGVLAGYPLVDVQRSSRRWKLARHGFIGDGVPDRRFYGASREAAKQSGRQAARAHHGSRSRHP